MSIRRSIPFIFVGIFFLLVLQSQGQNRDQVFTAVPDSLSCARTLDDFRIYFRSGYYGRAYQEWKKVYEQRPSFSSAIYIEGAPLLDTLIEKEENASRKQRLIDTLMKMYDDRVKYFGKDGYVMGRKAIEMVTYSPDKLSEANFLLKRSIELEGASTRPAIFVYFMSTTVELVFSGKADTNQLYSAYDLIYKNVLEALRVNQAEGNIYSNAFRNVEDYLRPFSKCNDFNTSILKKYQADSNNLPALKAMLKVLVDRKCYTSLIGKRIAKRIYSFDTIGEGTMNYGKYLLRCGEVGKATTYLYYGTKAENKDIAVESYLELSECYRFQDVPPRARNMVTKALELQPNNGNIYLYLGDIYRYAYEECGPKEMDKRSVYWIAADMYQKAMDVDPSVKAMASKKLADCILCFPTAEALKKSGLKEGESYKVPSWINEDTKIRARK